MTSQNGPLEIDIVMAAHGKLALSRAEICQTFFDGLRAASTSPLPVWTLLSEMDISGEHEQEQSQGSGFVEHAVTQSVVRELGFSEGELVRRSSDKNPKSANVWRIEQISDDGVSMVGEVENQDKTLNIDLAKFQAKFIVTPELEDEVLLMMIKMKMLMMMIT